MSSRLSVAERRRAPTDTHAGADRKDASEIIPRALLTARLSEFVRQGARSRRSAIEARVDALPGHVMQRLDAYANAHGLPRADALLLAAIEALDEE